MVSVIGNCTLYPSKVTQQSLSGEKLFSDTKCFLTTKIGFLSLQTNNTLQTQHAKVSQQDR